MRLDRKVAGLVAVAVLAVATFVVVTATRGSSCEAEPTEHSAARTWNEQLLGAIRQDFPAPTVHARNLFHHSAMLWDISVLSDDSNTGQTVLVDATELDDSLIEDLDALSDDERIEALHYASFRLLGHRYSPSEAGAAILAGFDEQMVQLCLDADLEQADGAGARVGVSIADHVVDTTLNDGSLETAGYVDERYEPVNPPLVVIGDEIELPEPNRWQPLSLDTPLTRNGLQIDDGPQQFVGPNWGWVDAFALDPSPDGLPIDPGPPPLLGIDDAFVTDAIEVIEYGRLLDPTDSPFIRTDPGANGNAELGEYEGPGHDLNPATGQPYEQIVSTQADYGRVVAEFWADGPDSETPPGHWNTIANLVGDRLVELDEPLVIDGVTVATRLDWDLRMYLALNGALHDAAIAAWGAKAHYDYVRPISMIRYLGDTGQLTETPGLVEVITPESSAVGQRHQFLSEHVGETAVLSWLGQPSNTEVQVAGVGWVLATNWLPYQRSSFVTPSFAGYVSGHSAFSRAAAEVLTAATGSAYFPGGLFTHVAERGSLGHEFGPTADVTLQWATYRDAADEAGRSRLFGGIHVRADDLEGRRLGAAVGIGAWERAQVVLG